MPTDGYTLVLALMTRESPPSSGLLSISPPVLFFVLGIVAVLVRSDLRIPKAITKLLSLYLLWAIGFRGGVELASAGITVETGRILALAFALSLIGPAWAYWFLRRILDRWNAAAIAGCYGSVSVVTFLTASTALDQNGVPFSGHMVAVMALMESPAIVVALLLLRLDERGRATDTVADATSRPGREGHSPRHSWPALLHESLLNGPVLLLLGSLVIGMLTGQRGYAAFKPLCTDIFSGVLAFFLLDMGLMVARRLRSVARMPLILPIFAVVAPLINGMLAIALSKVMGIPAGDSVLLAVLAASASYIAAPAALRAAIPKAEPSLYVTLAMGVTFPFNITLGIPLYFAVVQWLW